jgi:histone H3/H4
MLSDNSIKKILKKAGALRISDNAVKKLKILAENYASIISKKAVKNAEYSGRKTIKAKDIEEAAKTGD